MGKEVWEIHELGRIDTLILEKHFGKIQTDEVIITDERIQHIKSNHPDAYHMFQKYGAECVTNPDMIIEDTKHERTVFMLKQLDGVNLNVIIKIVLETDSNRLKNSVMTSYLLRQRNLEKLILKNRVLYRTE